MLHDIVSASLEPRLVCRFDGGIVVGGGTGRVDSVLFVRFAGVAKFLAENTFVREVPTMEEAV